jgi:hypothetical protein
METVLNWSVRKLSRLDIDFGRYLFDRINWDAQLLVLTGARGVGKTTLFVQHLKSLNLPATEAAYISLDSLYFSTHNLVDFAEEYVQQGGRILYLDEVQKYPNWSIEIKNIYDNLPELKLRISGSSTTEILNSQGDLSRRALFYNLNGLSFREYLQLKTKLELPVLKLEEILNNHEKIASELNLKFKPLQHFQNYLSSGYYPFFVEDEDNYHQKIRQIINTIIEVDIPVVHAIDYAAVHNIKKMLAIISQLVPFKPNVKQLSEKIGISRESFMRYLRLLEKADLIQLLYSSTKGISQLNKPEKIYLNNSNQAFALSDTLAIGNARETFFFNQLKAAHELSCPPKGDFYVDEKYTFEIGGKDKKFKQLEGVQNSYIAADNLELSTGKKVPLWLFGMMY